MQTNTRLELFKHAVEGSSQHVIFTDLDGRITYANKAVEWITGYTVDEVIGKTPKVWGGEMSPEFYRNLWHTIKVLEQPFIGTIRNRRKSGEAYTAHVLISPVFDKDHVLTGFVGVEEDITHTENIEESLHNQLQVTEAILTSMKEGLIIVGPDSIINRCNPEAAHLLGLEPVDILEKDYRNVIDIHQNGQPVASDSRPIVQALLEGKTTSADISDHYQYRHSDGHLFPVRLIVSPLLKDQKVSGAILLFSDITEEKEVDQVKNDFISLASHQLRTPLSTISWYTEVLLDGSLGDLNEKQRKYLGEIYKANWRLIDLVSSLLNISRIEMGTYLVNPVDLDLEKCSQAILDTLAPEIQKRNLTVTTKFATSLEPLMVDAKLLQIILENLLTNAIKYNHQNGKINLEICTEDDKTILITVADTGRGIPKDQQSRIFSKLFRADNAKDVDTEGSGLGLYIVRSIVQKVGGKISFESSEAGTTFFVHLPHQGMIASKSERALD